MLTPPGKMRYRDLIAVPKPDRKPRKNNAIPSKRTITRLIALTGVSPMYSIRTSGFGGLPYGIDVDNAATGFAIVRALRERAAVHPELFPADWREQAIPF